MTTQPPLTVDVDRVAAQGRSMLAGQQAEEAEQEKSSADRTGPTTRKPSEFREGHPHKSHCRAGGGANLHAPLGQDRFHPRKQSNQFGAPLRNQRDRVFRQPQLCCRISVGNSQAKKTVGFVPANFSHCEKFPVLPVVQVPVYAMRALSNPGLVLRLVGLASN